ncbi:uncharacterized protein toporsb [Salminus brasiliensis]|uniref:uncharacterized protein toporsb n=1 Tax=Salminus brasiliensis TaxID=930266 RepID=UPI003B83980E
MTPTKMKLRMRKKESGAKSSRRLLAETSPDSKCPICLDRFNNVASLDRCLHRFCFRCIHEWSKNKAECPLCKQPFRSIFHSVKAENDFKEFILAPVENGPVVAPPPADQTDSGMPSGRVRRPRAPRGGERRSRRQPNAAPVATSLDMRLEGLAEEAVDQEQGVHHMMLRLTEHRRSRVEERSLRRLRDQDVLAFRRALYRTGVRVRSSGWDSSRQRDISAAHLRRNPACLRRLLPWLQRELMVLYGSHGSLVTIVQQIIMSRITHYNMDDAAIRDELRPFLLARTDHFLHELVSFARSTLSMEAYDQQAVYECPAPSYEEDSSSNSSIIAISEDDDDSEGPDVTEHTTQERASPVPMATGGESSLSQSGWDDETPGPSYSTLLPSPSQSQAEGAEPTGASVQADKADSASGGAAGLHEDEEEECMIVGYVKPMAERTPELVQLSSDSSEEEQEAAAAETAAATVPKAEALSSQAQAPPSPNSYLTPLSPSSFPYASASRSPPLSVNRGSPGHAVSCRSRSAERESERQPRPERKEHFRDRSRSSSVSSVLSRRSGRSRSHRRSHSGSRHQEHPNHKESRRWSHQSSGRSPTVSIASDCSDSPRSPSWEQPKAKDRPRTKRNDEERDCAYSVSARDRSSQSSVCWDSPGHKTEQRKSRKRRRKGKEREKSQSPLGVNFTAQGRGHDARRRHGCHKHRLRTGSCSSSSSRSSSSSSSSSADTPPDRPCPEKPSGKRKYKTRHLERAAQRQSSQTPSRDKDRRGACSSPAKRHRGGTRERSRSPSVEIIFERRASDTQTHRWRRKRHKKRGRRDARERSSPTIITIDSDSDRTNDYQDCVTEVTTDTVDYQERVTKVSNSTTHDQHHVANVTSSNADSPSCVVKATSSTTEDRPNIVKVTSSTSDDQHSATKVTSSTTDEPHHATKMSNSTTVDQGHVAKVTNRTADKVTKSTEASSRSAEVTDSTTTCSRLVTDDCCSSLVDVMNSVVHSQDSAADTVDQSDPMTAASLGEGNRSLPPATALPSPSPESLSPVTPTERISSSPDCALNLEDCVVDVVDRELFNRSQHNTDPEQPGVTSDLSRDVSMPSDTRLLESILQELEDILPEEGQGAAARLEGDLTDNGVNQMEGGDVPPTDQSGSEREPGGADNTGTRSDSERGAETRPAV